MSVDPYMVLNLPRDADKASIERAYRMLAYALARTAIRVMKVRGVNLPTLDRRLIFS